MSRELKICILSEYAYSLLSGKGARVGGAELQMTIFAKELAKKSYDVSFVTFVRSSSSPEVIEGIKVYNPFNNRISGYTYLIPQNMYKLLKILNKINADIYIQKGTSPLIGVIAFYAKLKNRISMYLASSTRNVSIDLDMKTIKDLRNMFYRFGVKHCDYVICQTNDQKDLLKQTIGRDGNVIKNLYIPPPQIEYNQRDVSTLKVLWVGRMLKDKRPELFLKLAENIPEFRFCMIGGPSSEDPDCYRRIKDVASRINNLDFIGFVPHNKMNGYYAESSLLVNTSSNEGFPNTFLEAWGNYIPVVSLDFDPDEIICKHELGFHSENFYKLVEDTNTLLKNKSLRIKMGINGKRYVEREHSTNEMINEYEKLFNKIKVSDVKTS